MPICSAHRRKRCLPKPYPADPRPPALSPRPDVAGQLPMAGEVSLPKVMGDLNSPTSAYQRPPALWPVKLEHVK